MNRSSLRKLMASTLVLPGVITCACIAYFPFAGSALVRDDAMLHRPDLVFIMMGDDGQRTKRAFEVFKSSKATQIMLATCEPHAFGGLGVGHRSSDLAQQYLIKLGLSPEHLTVLPDVVTSTIDEVEALGRYLDAHPEILSVVLVSNWYHTSRIGWVVHNFLAEQIHRGLQVAVVSAPTRKGSAARWWTTEQTFLAVFNEHLKWVYYLLKHG